MQLTAKINIYIIITYIPRKRQTHYETVVELSYITI